MKIRTGFVSNSSSSSFCILGVTSSEIENQIDVEKLFNPNNEESWDDDWYELSDKFGFDSYYGFDNYYEEHCIGLSVSKLDENIPIIEQKKVLAEKLNEKFGTKFEANDIDFMVDGGCDY